MADEPVTPKRFEKPHWRTVLKQKALDMAKEIGDKVRVEEMKPKKR